MPIKPRLPSDMEVEINVETAKSNIRIIIIGEEDALPLVPYSHLGTVDSPTDPIVNFI